MRKGSNSFANPNIHVLNFIIIDLQTTYFPIHIPARVIISSLALKTTIKKKPPQVSRRGRETERKTSR